jgi:DNA-binding NarL/FixJ family response regulator
MTHLFLFTDEPVLLRGLQIALSASGEFQLSSLCGTTQQLMEALQKENADVLLADLTTDLTFGTLVDLQKQFPGLRIVLWVRSITTELAYQAIEHGVRGIVRKTLPIETLFKCLRMVSEGGLWFEETLKASFSSVRTISLTRRESQLVSLLSQGLKNKEIATTLFISEGTVKVYLSRLFHKLGVKDRFELALFGLKNMPAGGGFLEIPAPRAFQPQRKDVAQAQWLRSIVLERSNPKVRGPNTIYQS